MVGLELSAIKACNIGIQTSKACQETKINPNGETSTIAAAVSRLMNNNQRLGVFIKELEGKLAPILRTLPENPNKECGSRQTTCTLDELFKNMENETEGLIWFVSSIIERVEL